eukprot:GDKI01004053.1.p1 GENE.GDKI01004053.1~~GDKI01004053.1.p1  ORF type:complete len:300 (-),score=73.46 GDKI01004053.1:204-1103(-)
MAIRAASHAGSWYSDNAEKLSVELEGHLKLVTKLCSAPKAVICPHAGYSYCAETASWAWKNVDPEKVNRVIMLGPSHHKYLERCALPAHEVTAYATPLGDIKLDKQVLAELHSTNGFEQLAIDEDQREHSIEMMLPFLAHVMRGRAFTLVPIVVGAVSPALEQQYGRLLARYFQDPGTLFVISSDFSHWGKRFRYTYVKPDCTMLPLNQAIENLDKLGVSYIEKHDNQGFMNYLRIHGNTICGRHAIAILLHCFACFVPGSLQTAFLHYSQSSQVASAHDSCVAYASLVTAQTAPLQPL